MPEPDVMEDHSKQTSLGSIHAKIQRSMDDQADAAVQPKENEIAKKEENDPAISKKEEVQKQNEETPELSKKEEDSSVKTGKEEVQMKINTNSPRYNTQYFSLRNEESGKFLYVKQNVSSFDAIHDVIRNSKMYSIDSRELFSVTVLFVKAKEMTKEKFDSDHVLKEPVCIRLMGE